MYIWECPARNFSYKMFWEKKSFFFRIFTILRQRWISIIRVQVSDFVHHIWVAFTVMMKQGGRLDNRIQKFNQRERAGIRLAWSVLLPSKCPLWSAVWSSVSSVSSVVQCSSVCRGPGSYKPFSQFLPSHGPGLLASLCIFLSLPIQQELEHWKGQEE